eukprot:g69470.t1
MICSWLPPTASFSRRPMRTRAACVARSYSPGRPFSSAAHATVSQATLSWLHPNQRDFLVPASWEAAYVTLSRTTPELCDERLEGARAELQHCLACPRQCGVDRAKHTDGKGAVCGVGLQARVGSAFAHFGEEPVIQGVHGSGAIFFGGCNLRCVFCQNWDISQVRNAGMELGTSSIAGMMITLQNQHNCHNINLVTPEHVVPQVIQAVLSACTLGLRVPVVYNTSSYDSLRSLRLLEGIVDIYLADFKFWSKQSAKRLAKAEDYPERAREAILEMQRQVGFLKFGEDGVARRGVLLRHLVMPGLVAEGESIMEWTAKELGRDTYVHVMEQYNPSHLTRGGTNPSRANRHAAIARHISSAELEQVEACARKHGLWRFAHEAPDFAFCMHTRRWFACVWHDRSRGKFPYKGDFRCVCVYREVFYTVKRKSVCA